MQLGFARVCVEIYTAFDDYGGESRVELPIMIGEYILEREVEKEVRTQWGRLRGKKNWVELIN